VNANIGIMYPEMPVAIGPVVPYAEAARRGGHRLWFGHSSTVDSHLTMAALAGRGYPLQFGSAVALYPLFHPHGFAVQSQSVGRLTGQTYVAGIGPGSAQLQRSLYGAPMKAPVSSARKFLDQVKEIIPGPLQTGPADGPERVDKMFGSVETGLGVLRPSMARCAGRAAEWAITWLTPAGYLEDVLIPEMRASAAQHDRPAPRVAAVVHMAIRRGGRDPQKLAHAAVGAHLSAPHYTDMLRQGGVAVDQSDPWAGAGELVSSGTYLYGSADELVDSVADLHRRGVHEVVLNVFGVAKLHGAGQAVEDLEEILAALHAKSSARLTIPEHAIPRMSARSTEVVA
jgi:alkanesulfonate monooxygenase SsuD/methylene tetrahydromethanopterin reductase-like flavin-dependent oxidoreductase (luciferase family)